MAEDAAQATPSHREVVDKLLWRKFPVLNDGFVCLVDCMGDDGSVVQAARVSYGAGTKKVSGDRTLIRYLLRHRHTTPFEMAEIKLLVRVPMDCWRQWIRHRTANVNEYSTRYSVAIDSMQTTEDGQWRSQSAVNRQGSGEFLPVSDGEELTRTEHEFQEAAEKLYKARLETGVAREQARKDLPLCTYTEAYWKIDLHNLLHFLSFELNNDLDQGLDVGDKGERSQKTRMGLALKEMRDRQFTIAHEMNGETVTKNYRIFAGSKVRGAQQWKCVNL